MRTHLHPRRETRHDGEGFESRGSAMGALDRKSNPRRVNPPGPSLWETASGHTKAHSQGAPTQSYSPPYTSFSLFAASLVHSQASARRDGGGRDATALVTILIPNISISPSTRTQQVRRTVLVHGTRLGASPSDRNWGRVDEQQGWRPIEQERASKIGSSGSGESARSVSRL